MVGHDLTAWRKTRGWTRTELAAALGTTYASIYRYEKGLRAIPAPVVRCLELLAREEHIKRMLNTT